MAAPVENLAAEVAACSTMSSMNSLDRLIATAAARGGYCTATEAARLDVDPMALARSCRAGTLVRLRRNAYVLGEVWRAADADEQHRLRIRAILLGRPSSTASHFSALSLHGLPVWPHRRHVEVVAPVRRMWVTEQLRVRPQDPGTVRQSADGTPTVAVAVALRQVVAEHEPWVVVTLDAALHRGAVTRDELLGGAASDAMRRLVKAADPSCESVGETRTRVLLGDLGLRVESQVEIRDAAGNVVGRVDFLVERRVIVEFDGATKYAGADGPAALVAEKAREDALRALGYVVVRLTWSDLEHPERMGQKIRQALALAA